MFGLREVPCARAGVYPYAKIAAPKPVAFKKSRLLEQLSLTAILLFTTVNNTPGSEALHSTLKVTGQDPPVQWVTTTSSRRYVVTQKLHQFLGESIEVVEADGFQAKVAIDSGVSFACRATFL